MSSLRFESEELIKRKFGTADQFVMIFDDARKDFDQQIESELFSSLNPIVTAAFGTGVVIWHIHLGQAMTALLSTASAWVQLDPLTVRQGANVADEVLNG